MSKRKICVLTGTRAEYGLLKPVMRRIEESDRLELSIIVTGMHLLPEFGNTIDEIRKDGFRIDAEVPSVVSGSTKISMSMSIGLGTIGMTQAFEMVDPDVVLILGDRFEAFAAAIAASYSGRVVAHLSGGDSPQAGFDEYTRHAITKISHLHFPSTEKSAERIRRLGENPDYVFTVGSTALDTILFRKGRSREEVYNHYHLDPTKPLLLVVQHPLSTEPEDALSEMRATLEAVIELDVQAIVIYPNVDPGGIRIVQAIQEFEAGYPHRLKAYRSLPFEDYLDIMRCADVMVGNSSSGIIESSAFHLPVVNIGNRQKGRERAENVLDVPHNKEAIRNAIVCALTDEVFRKEVLNCQNPYGDGTASEKIVRVLSETEFTEDMYNKKLTY